MHFCEKEVAYIDIVLSFFSFQLLESKLIQEEMGVSEISGLGSFWYWIS
jgi:hypothetical protein